MQRRQAFLLLAAAMGSVGVLEATSAAQQAQTSQAHVAWVAEVLKRMLEIKPGMTRKTLLTVFATEGGLSTGLNRTFVSRDCPYFKVDVEFQAVGRANQDDDGRVTIVEGPEDQILKVSKPYLWGAVTD